MGPGWQRKGRRPPFARANGPGLWESHHVQNELASSAVDALTRAPRCSYGTIDWLSGLARPDLRGRRGFGSEGGYFWDPAVGRYFYPPRHPPGSWGIHPWA